VKNKLLDEEGLGDAGMLEKYILKKMPHSFYTLE
jgi:hypothetical protein